MRRRVSTPQRWTAGFTAAVLAASQVALPTRAEASHLGSSTASAGSAPPPAASLIESFQPDLFTGRATTSIPIAVPPGRKGMQPALALVYSSSGRNGWVGHGWSLDVGSIERSTKLGVPKDGASDSYTFMFQGVSSDLVKIPDGTYRAQDEGAFLKFINNGVSGWEVRDKSGSRYLFGQTPASQVESAGQVFRWALEKVIDPSGNTQVITYTKDQNQLYPSRIDYTGHEPTGLAPANRVTFLLEDRPDDEVGYRSGFAVTTAKRLKEIAAYAPDPQGQPLQLARSYVLTYAASGRTGRSLLSSIQQVGTDGTTSLPATTFTYQSAGTASYPNVLNNFQPPPSVAAWNVRKAGLDTGHENWGCAHPHLGLPWGSPVQASGSFDLSCLSGNVSANGDVTMSGCNDHFGHVWTYVYVGQARTLSLSPGAGGCLYREDAGGVTLITDPGSIALQRGWSILHMTSYHQHSGWGPVPLSGGLKNQVDVMNPSQIALGIPQLAGDVNGDAKTDLIKFTPSSGNWSVSRATSSTLSPDSLWLAGFGNSSSSPLLGDWNGDGRTDIGIFDSGGWQFATSTGTSFQTGTVSGLSFGGGTPLTGDFNGDAVTDLGTYNNGAWSVASGTGSGFSPAGSFSLSWGDTNHDALTGDFNGDGLTDIGLVNKSSGAIDVRLSTGAGWTGATNWIGSFGGATPHTSADFNGDGLTDAVYYNRPAGQVIYAPSTGSGFGASVTLPLTFSLTSTDDTIQVGDFNGDGIADPAAFNILSGSSQLAFSSLTNADGSNGAATDVLRAVHNGVGGTTTIRYQPSSLCGCDQESILPFAIPLVQQTTQEDGLGNRYTSTYMFHGGLYDGLSKEFRGFAEATVFDADGNKSITRFHQDAQKKGRPFRTELRDRYDALWTKAEQTWSATDPYPGVHFVHLDQTDHYTYDGDASFKQARSRVLYDGYGNVSRTDEDGDVAVSGDERATVTQFAYNDPAWIVNRPTLTQTLDAAGAVIAQRRFYYDGATDINTLPTAGHLTKEEEWLNLPTPRWLATTMTYDAYGNVATVTDTLARTTTNAYDPATHTFLDVITNHLKHTRRLTSDPRFGQVTSSIDQNGVKHFTQYDVFGRVTSTGFFDPSTGLPVIVSTLSYDLSSVPTRTQHTVFPDPITPIVSYQFFDGLGRLIQTRSPSEDPTKQVVSGFVAFNARGQVARQGLPYRSQVAAAYIDVSREPPASSAAVVTYTYDPPGRLLTITDPDGSVTRTAYQDWTVTSTDANGNTTRRASDAFGRLATVEEVNGLETSTTRYAYDALGNLTQVTDAQGHITRITYDSLGRKLAMDDPDMGRWTYAYDEVDNLKSQTDARGVTIGFAYDALNRLTTKAYTIPPGSGIANPGAVAYTYDGADDPAKRDAKGTLTKIVDGSGSSSFEYDHLGRLVKEAKVVDSTPYAIARTYDLLGRLTSLAYPDAEAARYTYNPQGGLETVSLQPVGASPQPVVTNVEYTEGGQLRQITYGNGVTTNYSYDPNTLRLKELSTLGPGGLRLQDFSYEFDRVGNVTAINDRVNTSTQGFSYDGLNRLTQARGTYNGTFRTLTYAYDAIGNMVEKEGMRMAYGLADGSKPHAVTSTDPGPGVQGPGLRLAYDANGNMIQKATDRGPSLVDLAAQSLRYDAENRLVDVSTAPDHTETVVLQPGWNFFSLPVIPNDAAAGAIFPNFAQDLEQISRFDPATGTFRHSVGDPQFDDFSQLEYGVGYEIYCKAAGPVTVTLTGKLPTRKLSTSLSPGWHLLGSTVLAETPVATWLAGVDYADVRDATLSPVTQVKAAQAYWVFVRTASTFSPSLPRDPTTTFVYDGDGGRVKQTTAAGTTVFLGQSFEVAPDGTATKYLFAGSQRVASVTQSPQPGAPSQVRFYHADHLGSTHLVTDETGALVERTEYTPFGAVARRDTVPGSERREVPGSVSHGFTGQRLDASTGLYFYHARYYDPALGRFIQPDPLVPAPADPQALNRYTYVRNNPLKFVDPSGHGWFSKFFSSILQALGILLAPFTAGQSLWLSVAGTVWSGVQAAQAGQFGAWAAGFAVSMALGAIIPVPNFSNLYLQAGISVLKGAAIGAIAGGVGSLVAGGSFGEGAGYGAIGGAAGGAVAGIATSQQYQNWARKEGFLSNREVRANHYRRDNAKLHALSVKAKERVSLTAGARDIEGPIKAGHEYMAAPNTNRFEIGPRDGSIVTSNTTDVSTWRTSLTTDNAIAAGMARTTTVQVSPYIVDSMALYEAYWVGEPYQPCCWSSFNSNFGVNSVIYGGGGPEKITGVGYAPGFPDN